MQRLFLLLTVIISRAVASPIAQSYPDDSFDIALSDFNNPGIAAPEPFQIAEIGKPSQAPAQTPQAPDVAQPGDPVLRQKPQPKPQIPSQVPGGDNPGEQKATNQPFDCGPGKSGACCVGGTRDGVTAGCIRFVVYDDWCQKSEWFKCCKSQPEKDSQIEKGLALDDHTRQDCEDPKEIEWEPQQNWGNNLLRMIVPQGSGVGSGLSFPEGIWVPNQ